MNSEKMKDLTAKYSKRIFDIGKWLVLGIIIGLLCGVLGTIFDVAVEYATEFRKEYPQLLYALPFLGLLICGLYKLLKMNGHSTNSVIASVHTKTHVPLRLFPAIFIGTVLTQLGGGSAGREGAALQMGGSLGSAVGKVFKLKNHELGVAILAGMAGYFSAIFGTPVTSAVFVITVVHVGISINEALLPCVTAAVVAFKCANVLGVEPTRIAVSTPSLETKWIVLTVVLSFIATIVSVIFYKGVHLTEHLADHYIKNPWIRVFAGGAAIIVLTLLVGSQRYNGAGMNIIYEIFETGKASHWDWILKIVFTCITLATGFKGGEVVPSFFIGASFGCAMAPLLGIDPGFGAAIGLVSVFCAATNCVLGSIFLSVELFGAEGLPYFAIACAVSYIFSGDSSLYSTQKIYELTDLFKLPKKEVIITESDGKTIIKERGMDQ